MVSDPESRLPRRELLPVGTRAGILVFALYVLAAPPGMYWADSGELTLGGLLLGLAHAPSFPSYALLVRAASLIPIGDQAFRATLVSAACGALGCALLFAGTRDLLKSVRGGVLATGLFALSPAAWQVSVRQEVYTLHLLLAGGILAMLVRWWKDGAPHDAAPHNAAPRDAAPHDAAPHNAAPRDAAPHDAAPHRTRHPGWLFVAGLLFGLALGNHSLLTLALFPPLALALLATGSRQILSARVLAHTVTAFLLGLSVYLTLPIRSSRNPALDWNDPERLQGFVDSFTKRHETALFLGDGGALSHLGTFLGALVENFSPLLVGLAAFGLVPLWRRQPLLLSTLVLLFAFNVATIVLGPRYDPDNPDIPGYLLLAYAVWALLCAAGAMRLGTGLEHSVGNRLSARARTGLAWLGASGLVLLAWVLTPPRVPAADDRRTDAFVRLHLAPLPTGAIALVKSDALTFLGWYSLWGEGRRPDLIWVNRKGLLSTAYLSQLERLEPLFGDGLSTNTGRRIRLEAPVPSDSSPEAARMLGGLDPSALLGRPLHALLERLLPERPVHWELAADNAWLYSLGRLRGPWLELSPHRQRRTEQEHLSSLELQAELLERLCGSEPPTDPRAARAGEVLVNNLANQLRLEGPAPLPQQLLAYERLWRVRPNLIQAGGMTALLQARLELPAAVETARAVTEVHPGHDAAWVIWARVLLAAGMRPQAEAVMAEARRRFPLSSPLEQLQGVLPTRQAEREWQEALDRTTDLGYELPVTPSEFPPEEEAGREASP